jgi:hypothetical protein
MQTRSGWLALLLTAGVALAPTVGRAQEEVPFADPQIPLPIYHDRASKGGFYAAAEFVFYRMDNPIRHQIIAIRGLEDFDGTIIRDINSIFVPTPGGPLMVNPGNPPQGILLGSGTIALDAQQVSGPLSYQPGVKVSVGWRFEDGVTAEFSWLQLTQAKYNAVATLVPASLNVNQFFVDSFLFSPVFNYPSDFAGPARKVLAGNDFAAYGIWNGAAVESISFVQRYTQYDLTFRIPIVDSEYCRCYGLVGARHTYLWERFAWRTVSQDLLSEAGQDDVALYSNVVSNQLYGVTVGVGSDWYIGKAFGLVLDLKAIGNVDIVHEIAKYERADLSIGNKRAKRDYTLAPELDGDLSVFWYPFEGIEVKAGYNLIEIFNTVASRAPVDFNYSLDPHWDKGVQRFMDGFHIGIGFIF